MSIKNIAFFLLMALPFGAQAADLSIAEANQSVIDSCKKTGGDFKGFTVGECEYQRCVYSDNKSDGKYYRSGDNKKTNCTDEQLKKALEGVRDSLGVDLEPRKGSAGGAAGGSTAGANGAAGGAGAAAGANAGANADTDGKVECREELGDVVMTPNAACYYECTGIDGSIFNRHRVFKIGKKGCIDCLMRSGYTINPKYLPKDKQGNIKGTISAKGVLAPTGRIICEWIPNNKLGKNGQFEHQGTNCPPDSRVLPNGQVLVGSGTGNSGDVRGRVVGTGSAGGPVIISGGVTASAGGGSVTVGTSGLPAFCIEGKHYDKKACLKWRQSSGRFRCSSSDDIRLCADIDEINSRYSGDYCVNCEAARRQKQGGGFLSGLAEVVGAAAPIAMTGLGAYFGYKSNKAWAGAAATGFEQCQLDHNNYYGYLSANELPGLTPEQQAAMGCNGYSLGQFAGMGGMFGGLMGAGYSPGFIGGMMGPYGGYNPYGMGGMVGGAVGGMYPAGGMVGGMYPAGGMVAGGMYGGYMTGSMAAGYPVGGMMAAGYPAGGGLVGGGLVNGISLAGGMAAGAYTAGYPAGGMYTAGYPAGGMVAGGMYTAGYPVGGYVAGGYSAGYPAGGMMTAGYPAGGLVGGGLVNGISLAGGVAAGAYTAGYPAGGMYTAGYPAGGMMAAGYPAGGYVAGGIAGGIGVGGYPGMGGYPYGSAYGTGIGYPGGYGPMGYPGTGYYGMASGMGNIQASMQTSSRDAMLQQQGVNMQVQGLLTGSYGAGGTSMGMGTAAFSPYNMPYGMQAGYFVQ